MRRILPFLISIVLLSSCSTHPLERPDVPPTPDTPAVTPDIPDNPDTPDIPDLPPEPAEVTTAATYIHDCCRWPVTVSAHAMGEDLLLRVTGEEFIRNILLRQHGQDDCTDIPVLLQACTASDIVLLPQTADGTTIEPLGTAAERLKKEGRYTDYIYNVENAVDDDGHRLHLAVAYIDPDGTVSPAIDCVEFPGDEWEFIAIGTFIDGWLLPAVTVNAQRLDPAAHPWPVELHRRGDILRVSGMYRGSHCPLSESNGAPATAALYIHYKVKGIPRQEAPFVNPDLWTEKLYMADAGGANVFDSTLQTTITRRDDGTVVINIPYPAIGLPLTAGNMHPLDGNGPAILTFTADFL